jgi:hypothetical protein
MKVFNVLIPENNVTEVEQLVTAWERCKPFSEQGHNAFITLKTRVFELWEVTTPEEEKIAAYAEVLDVLGI